MSTPGKPFGSSSAASDIKSGIKWTDAEAIGIAAADAAARASSDDASRPPSGAPFPPGSGGGGGGGGSGPILASSLPLTYSSLLQLIESSDKYNASMKSVLRNAIELVNRVGSSDISWITHAIYTITSAPITQLRDGADGESDCRQLLTCLAPGQISTTILADSATFQNANEGTSNLFTLRALLTWNGKMKRIPLLHRYAQLSFVLANTKGGSRNAAAVKIMDRYIAEQREILMQLVMSCGRCD